MSAQQEVTQILDLGTGTDQNPQAVGSQSINGTGAFNSTFAAGTGSFAVGATGLQSVAAEPIPKDVGLDSGLIGNIKARKTLLIVATVLLGLVGLIMFGPVSADDFLVTLGLSEPETPPVKLPPKAAPKAPEPAPKVVTEAPPKPVVASDENIWNVIKNELGDDLPELAATLSSDQEALFKDKLSHPFVYQHYVGVTELAGLRAQGSEELLRSALESNKFWTRMRALIGLADLGSEITSEDVKLALGDAHRELRARFFKRFEKSFCSVGCFYVARAALPFLDELGRAQAIQVISREESDARDRFMVAASYDQSERVRQTAIDWLSHNDVDEATRTEIKTALGR